MVLSNMRLTALLGTDFWNDSCEPRELAEAVGLRPIEPKFPTPAGLVAAASLDADPEPLVPLYLRRPDAEEPGKRKSVLTR